MSETFNFPKNFLWGTSVSAHQVEGNNKNNDWWMFEQNGGVANNQKSGSSVDHYSRFKEDFALAEKLNQNIFRFSIEWSRIEPREGEFDEAELAHYEEVLKSLKHHGMKSMVTLFHFTLPNWFAESGGWERKDAVLKFAQCANVVVERLSPLVDFWITINEPTVYATNAYWKGYFPPQERNIIKFNAVINNLLRANKEVYSLIHSKNKSATVGFSHHNVHFEAANPKSLIDRLAVQFADYYGNKRVLSSLYKYSDFIGIQYYVRILLHFHPGGEHLNLFEEYGITKHLSNDIPLTDVGWEMYPKGLFYALESLKKYSKPVIITENGLADRNDTHRREFIRQHLKSVALAIKDRVDVRGYIHWSLLDNFEWTLGHDPRYGLVGIDYENDLKRKVRPSANFFAKICASNSIEI